MGQLEIGDAGETWDRELARLGGHPWQSALWGDAQCDVLGVRDHRLLVRSGGEVAQMVRIEEREITGLGRLAWIRRGPGSAALVPEPGRLRAEVVEWLSGRGFFLAVSDPWRASRADEGGADGRERPQTIWIDLSVGRDRLWRGLQTHWRNGVMKAQRRGIAVSTTCDPALVAEYFRLCTHIGEVKGFRIRTTPELILRLVTAPRSDAAEAELFLAMCEGQIAAGALILRCGKSVHYMGGASNRAFSRRHPGEALHWAVIESALGKGCTCYDLEGIDPKGNPGTYAFKKKMGGEEVTLVGRSVEPLNGLGRMLAPVARRVMSSRLPALPTLAQALIARRRS
ncbi:MAG: GNAT family N-acetyltransferase [Hyphomicrobiaceae bacterium]|nr:GNAT family N-acetyltransferase [Hyphomicrobiaceae bacterium]